MGNVNNINLNFCCQKALKKHIIITSDENAINYRNLIQCGECGRILNMICKTVEDEIVDLTANEGGLMESGKDGIKL